MPLVSGDSDSSCTALLEEDDCVEVTGSLTNEAIANPNLAVSQYQIAVEMWKKVDSGLCASPE
jgi:hypothetical protein